MVWDLDRFSWPNLAGSWLIRFSTPRIGWFGPVGKPWFIGPWCQDKPNSYIEERVNKLYEANKYTITLSNTNNLKNRKRLFFCVIISPSVVFFLYFLPTWHDHPIGNNTNLWWVEALWCPHSRKIVDGLMEALKNQ